MASRKIITPEFRCSFANLLTPSEGRGGSGEPNGKFSYSVTALFDPTDVAEIEKLVEEAVFEKWGKNPPVLWRHPLRQGTPVSRANPGGYDLEKYPENKGKMVATLKAGTTRYADGSFDVSKKPNLVDWNNEPIIDRAEVYSGMYARAQIVARAYDKGSEGVNLYLHNVQKTRDGEPLGSARDKAEDVFAPFAAVPSSTNNDMFDDIADV